MLSESQERMLIIVKKGREAEVQRIFDKWDLPWAEIGFVTDTGRMVVRHGGKVVADIPAKKIADESPVYQRESREPAYLTEVRAFTLDANRRYHRSPIADLKTLLAWPTHRFEELGLSPIRSHGARRHGCCAGQRRGGASHQERFVAVSRAGSERRTVADFESSGEIHRHDRGLQRRLRLSRSVRRRKDRGGRSVPQSRLLRRGAARRDGQSEFRPTRTTPKCSSNSRNPCAAWPKRAELSTRRSPAAIARSTIRIPNGPIDPTPTVAMVGLIEKPEHITTQWFKDEGDAIILLGDTVDAADPLAGPRRLRLSASHSRQENRHAAALRSGEGENACTTTLLGLIPRA